MRDLSKRAVPFGGAPESEISLVNSSGFNPLLSSNTNLCTAAGSGVDCRYTWGQEETTRTDSSTNFAINGDGFFMLEDSEGNCFLTRLGAFDWWFTDNGDWELSTFDGQCAVLDPNGKRIVLEEPKDFEKSQIGVFRVEMPSKLIHAGKARYSYQGADEPVVVQIPEFEQGFLAVSQSDSLVSVEAADLGIRISVLNQISREYLDELRKASENQ
jgi:flagellar basal body rod protein FlgG